MTPYDMVRSILARARLPHPYEPGAPDALPDPGPPIPAPAPPDVYDPVFAAYEDASPAYEPPPEWFEGMPITGTPSPPHVRHVVKEVEPDRVRYDQAPLDQALFNVLMQAAIDEAGLQGPPFAPAEISAPEAMPDVYSAPEPVQPEIDPVALMDAAVDYQMQLMSEMPQPVAPDQIDPSIPLERIVELEFERTADLAGMMPPPDMPMDPFGSMGPAAEPIM